MAIKVAPIHPGEVLREEFLKPLDLSPYAVAKALNLPRTRIERIAGEKFGVTADTALHLARYFGTTAHFWMNLQSDYDLQIAKEEIGKKLQRIRRFKRAT